MCELINNIDKIQTTDLGIERIKRNLSLEVDNIVHWCKNKILNEHANITAHASKK